MTLSPITVRIAFWPYWLFIYAEGAIGFTLVLFILHGNKIDWPVYWVILGIMIGLAAVGTWGMQWLVVVRVTNTEIKGFNSLCFPTTFLWEDVSEIKPFNFLGIKYLRIYSTKHYWARGFLYKFQIALQLSRALPIWTKSRVGYRPTWSLMSFMFLLSKLSLLPQSR